MSSQTKKPNATIKNRKRRDGMYENVTEITLSELEQEIKHEL